MSERKTVKNEDKPKVYPTSEILKSKKIKEKYQRDFAKAILSEPAYTLADAVEALETALGKKEAR